MSDLTLVIGNKASSSWSLRPWLALKQIGVPFREITIPLRQPETKAEILQHSPAGKVPVLRDGDLTVYDLLAILEYLAESYPEAGLWPEDRGARAVAQVDFGGDAFRLRRSAQEHADGCDRQASGGGAYAGVLWPISPASPRSGATPRLASGPTARSCSAVSRPPTPCTRRSAPGWIPIAWSWTRFPKPTSPPCSACRPCASGTPRVRRSRGGRCSDGLARAGASSLSAGWAVAARPWLPSALRLRGRSGRRPDGAGRQAVQRAAQLDRRPLGVPVVEQPARVRVP